MKLLPGDRIVSQSEEETLTIGECLSEVLLPGTTVFLLGEIGAGKTTLVRGFCRSLGCGEKVRSPSFTLVHEYTTAKGEMIVHSDLYRLDAGDVEDLDLESYVDEGAILFVEWAERGVFPTGERRWTVEFSSPDTGQDTPHRVLSFSVKGEERHRLDAFLDTVRRKERNHGASSLD